MQIFTSFFLLSTTTAYAASLIPVHAPSLLAQARKAGAKVAIEARACNIPDYNPGRITFNLPDFDADKAQVYRYRQQQAVNLGSWFVHEQWMVPTIFSCAANDKQSEIDIASGWGGVDGAKEVLEKQWDTFITEDDFAYLAKIGINTVRLPMGFWSLGPDFTKGSVFEDVGSVYENSWPRIMRAHEWAGKYGIGILVDMHGAYGSQNGQQHSGISDGKTNLFNSEKDQDLTIKALVYMTEQLVNVTNCVGIQILNEPDSVSNLPTFYDNAITAMRKVSGADQFPLYVHDGFDISKFSQYVGGRDDFTVVDHHSYFVFTDSDQSKPVTALTSMIKSSVADNIGSNAQTARGNLVTDEWGCALAEGSTKVSNLDSATKAYCTGQEEVYRNSGAGYAFWSYLTEGCKEGDQDGWCFKGSVGNNLPSTFFSYRSQTEPSDGIALGSGSGSSSSSSSSSSSETATSTTKSSTTTRTSTASALEDSATPSPTSSCKVSKKKRTQSRRRHHQRALDNLQRGVAKRASTESQGYKDGFDAAKKFASMGGSRVGFKRQFAKDTAGDAATDSYIDDFMQGVTDAEAAVEETLKQRK